MIKELVSLIAKLQNLVKTGFHGSVTVHFANGVPRKIKTELSEDL